MKKNYIWGTDVEFSLQLYCFRQIFGCKVHIFGKSGLSFLVKVQGNSGRMFPFRLLNFAYSHFAYYLEISAISSTHLLVTKSS